MIQRNGQERSGEGVILWAIIDLLVVGGLLVLGQSMRLSGGLRDAKGENETIICALQDAENAKKDLDNKLSAAEKDRDEQQALVRALEGKLVALREKGDKDVKQEKDKRLTVEEKLSAALKRLTKAEQDLVAIRSAHEAATKTLNEEIKKLNASLVLLTGEKDGRVKAQKDADAARTDAAKAKAEADKLKEQLVQLNKLLVENKNLLDVEIIKKRELQTFIDSNQVVPEKVLGLKHRKSGAMKRVAILIDTSGSMQTSDPLYGNRWNYTRELITTWLEHLALEEAVVVRFGINGGSVAVYENKPINLRDKQIKAQLLKTVKSWEPGGSTPTYEALEAAYKFDEKGKPLDAILLFTDGAPDGNIDGIHRLAKGKKHIPINAIAVGDYFSSPSLPKFLIQLAQETEGSFQGR